MNRPSSAPLGRHIQHYIKATLEQPYRSISKATTLYYNASPASSTSSHTDWNTHDVFFKITRGRFLVDEAENLRMREIKFDMNDSPKYPDGMFNKAFLMSMDNGREVVAKVPNPNSGIPHLTTASEVATMNFVYPTTSINAGSS
ncbi:hypothetical protein CBS63078_3396 [Aspergillus niger]|nr:hypothetical protein CBS133816_9911 [Aspergillus niger]KAI2823714.1 hypothetical protein CBS115989_1303 [Aspergillus niger]KAI2838169.1 hypothetical protein CBS11350_8383 [Aspergillus niger]KAI2858735.1 hypothetical protein CBS11232_2501 [Aspergillus niger]KAI2879546.1 hypothetical protein CBS115988_2082 [Aspergillus niger]